VGDRAVSIWTNGVSRLAIDGAGVATISGNLTVDGNTTLGDDSSDTLTVNAVDDGTPTKCIGIDGSNKLVSYAVPAGGGSICKMTFYRVGASSASAVALEQFPDFSQQVGYQILASDYVVKLLGFEIVAGSGGCSQATSVTVRIAERARDQASAYTAGAGTTLASESALTRAGAASTRYSIGDSVLLSSPVTVTAGRQVFCDLTTNYWLLTDIAVCAILSIEEA